MTLFKRLRPFINLLNNFKQSINPGQLILPCFVSGGFMIILGAGLSGCIACLMIPGSQVYEPLSEVKTHQALLRFKNDSISKTLGIPFKKVKVYKGIRHNDRFVELSPHYITRYARKVSGKLSHRSICDLTTSERYIAPKDFHNRLIEIVKPKYNSPFGTSTFNETVLSTIPIEITASNLNIPIPKLQYESIYISRFKIPNCDMHLTYYFTGTNTAVYRASIVEDELIIESTFEILKQDITEVSNAFGLMGIKLEPIIENYEQKYGKITPWDDAERKRVLYQLTKEYGIYSLGRFATWRNITLDDVYDDILKIKKWINQSEYDRIIK